MQPLQTATGSLQSLVTVWVIHNFKVSSLKPAYARAPNQAGAVATFPSAVTGVEAPIVPMCAHRATLAEEEGLPSKNQEYR
jgi:hypothetical protein